MVYPDKRQFTEIMNTFDKWEAKLKNPHQDVESTIKKTTIEMWMRNDFFKLVCICVTGNLPTNL